MELCLLSVQGHIPTSITQEQVCGVPVWQSIPSWFDAFNSKKTDVQGQYFHISSKRSDGSQHKSVVSVLPQANRNATDRIGNERAVVYVPIESAG